MSEEGRKLSPVPDWLTGIVIGTESHEVDDYNGERMTWPRPALRCRQCGELLTTLDLNEPLWVLADVARDHRQFCRDTEERIGDHST
jgi:hypothetical protein